MEIINQNCVELDTILILSTCLKIIKSNSNPQMNLVMCKNQKITQAGGKCLDMMNEDLDNS